MVPHLVTFLLRQIPQICLILLRYEYIGLYSKGLCYVLRDATAEKGTVLNSVVYANVGRLVEHHLSSGWTSVWRNTARSVLPDGARSTWYAVVYDAPPTNARIS